MLVAAGCGAIISLLLFAAAAIFARRNVAPVLQQLESEHSQDISVNDCFKPVSRYWDRIYGMVNQLLRNQQDAEEVTQDAFIRAHRGLVNFRGDSAFSTSSCVS